jgi:hypothetical protein
MKALASIPGAQSVTLPRGKLSVHEEFPDLIFGAIEPFLFDPSH